MDVVVDLLLLDGEHLNLVLERACTVASSREPQELSDPGFDESKEQPARRGG